MHLGAKVKRAREKRGMNQKELADASGITQATISRIESGQAKEPKSETLKKLASALAVTADYLIGADKTDELTPEDLLRSDRDAQYIFRGYEKLSPTHREQLRDFVRFLEEQEEKGQGNER